MPLVLGSKSSALSSVGVSPNASSGRNGAFSASLTRNPPEDFNLELGALTINKSFVRKGGKDAIGLPKKKMPCRTIMLSDLLVEELRVWFEHGGLIEGERMFPVVKHCLWREMKRGCAKSGGQVHPRPRSAPQPRVDADTYGIQRRGHSCENGA